jgi:DNA polymerase III delta' subunit
MSEIEIGNYPWLVPLWQRLEKAWVAGRLAHAYAILGGAGDGLLEFGHRLTQILCCQNKVAWQACGQCSGCKQALQQQHPDVCLVQASEHTIKIDQIRELTVWLQTTRYYQTPRVILLYPACRMNESAANALLKILEEPPPHTHFFLLSTQSRPLPATVRSRCQILRLAHLPPLEANAWLRAQSQQSLEHCDQARQLFGSQLLAAKAWLASEWPSIFAERLNELEQALYSKEYPESLSVAWSKSGQDHGLFLTAWQQWCGQLIAQTLSGDKRKIAFKLPPEQVLPWLWQMWDRLLLTRQHLQSGVALQPRLFYEALLYSWVQPLRGA